MAGSIPEEGTRVSRERDPGRGPGREFWALVQRRGGFQGRSPGSVEPGRAAQDEGGILASLSRLRGERAGKGLLGMPPSYRQIWMADGASVAGPDILSATVDGSGS